MKLDLNDREQYDIACALRGPDTKGGGAVLLKFITTAVIRYFVEIPNWGSVITLSPVRASREWEVVAPAYRDKVRLLWAESSHFKNHVKYALRALLRLNSGEAKERIEAYIHWLADELKDAVFELGVFGEWKEG